MTSYSIAGACADTQQGNNDSGTSTDYPIMTALPLSNPTCQEFKTFTYVELQSLDTCRNKDAFTLTDSKAVAFVVGNSSIAGGTYENHE